MTGTSEGGQKSAASRVGISQAEYLAHIEAGERRCWDCKAWKSASDFRRRRGYSTTLSAQCIDCHRDYMREYMRERYSR